MIIMIVLLIVVIVIVKVVVMVMVMVMAMVNMEIIAQILIILLWWNNIINNCIYIWIKAILMQGIVTVKVTCKKTTAHYQNTT